jgi:hypothetical protein
MFQINGRKYVSDSNLIYFGWQKVVERILVLQKVEEIVNGSRCSGLRK